MVSESPFYHEGPESSLRLIFLAHETACYDSHTTTVGRHFVRVIARPHSILSGR